MQRDSRTRNFNTSARGRSYSSYSPRHTRRGQRRGGDNKNVVYLIILIVIALIIAALAILLISSAIANAQNGQNPGKAPSNATPLSKDQLSATVQMSSDDVRVGDLILVNASYPCLKLTEAEYLNIYENAAKVTSFTTGNEVSAFYPSLTETVIHKNVMAALNDLGVAAYNKAGNNDLTVKINKVLEYTDGKTEDQSGLMVDFYVYTANQETYKLDAVELGGVYNWIFTDCYKYGFIQRGEAYQFRYVGIPHATYMAKNSLSLENYLAKLKSEYSYDSGNYLIVDGDDGHRYQTYYVPSAGDATDIPVPSGSEYKYSVSGDNMDGFIVTITLG